MTQGMSIMPLAEETPLPHLLRSVDAVCDSFELALCQAGSARIEDYLDSVQQELQPVLLSELIRIELEWRCRGGQEPTAQEYGTRFPSCADRAEGWLAEARAAAASMAQTRGEDTAAADSSATGVFEAVPPATPAVAPQRLGEYELLEPLGAGGMGEVYRARHVRLDKLVALKLLPAHSPQRKERLARFLREMKALGSLDHPNLVEAFDAGESGDVVYLAMKLIDGADLGKLVRERGPLPVSEACELARQAALGLDYLHQRRLIHRDIKPSNLMRTSAGVVKVLDLGLARWNRDDGQVTTLGLVLGTPDYLAPEQAVGERVDARSDVYGLGGTLFFLLTGRAPFSHRTGMLDKLDAHRRETPPDVRSLRPEVPAALALLVGRMLAKRPEDRPQTAAEVAALLAGFPADSAADTTVAVEPFSRPAGSKRWRGWLTAACGLAVLLALVVSLLPKSWPRQDTPASVPATIQDGPRQEPAEPVLTKAQVLKLEVSHFETVGKKDRPCGVLGKKSFTTRQDDSVIVAALLSRPAYAYLIAFRPDGSDDVCFPEKEDETPTLTEQPSYPSVSQGVHYGLNEGTGLHAFALVVSSKPLPAYKEWRAQRGPSPWKKHPALAGVVWYDNGTQIEGRTADTPGTRGKGREVTGKTPLVRLTSWLRQDRDIEAVAAVGFAVVPAGPP